MNSCCPHLRPVSCTPFDGAPAIAGRASRDEPRHTPMSDTFSKVEVITGVARRRSFSTELKLAVVAETMQPGISISYVAPQRGLSPSLVFRWRRLMNEGGKEAVRADDAVVPASEVRRLEERVRELERLLGQDHGSRDPEGGARSGAGKKTDIAVALAAAGRHPVKAVAATLGVARSNIIEPRDGQRPRRGPQERPGQLDVAGAIRDLVDKRPSYGYRRIAALLRRQRRRAAGEPQVNAKRVYRLMKSTVARTAYRSPTPREHDGQVATIRLPLVLGHAGDCPLERRDRPASPSPSIAMTGRSSAGWPAPSASPAR
jgi:transposase-like protein